MVVKRGLLPAISTALALVIAAAAPALGAFRASEPDPLMQQSLLRVQDMVTAGKTADYGPVVAVGWRQGTKPGELMGPLGIAIDRSGDIYVADSGNNRIVKYSTGGVAKKAWGKQGMGRGELVYPTAVAVNSQNEIVVVDRVHVQRFPPEGEVVAAWGKGGTGDGELNRPLGLAVDAQNYIYVADTGNNRVQKFDLNGRFVAKWGSAGTGDGQMMGPVSVAVNNKGNIFVLELENNRLQEFKVPAQ